MIYQNDCSSKVSTKEAKTRKCINAEWPDSYGHYRQAEVTQIKHHWWWKANRIFNELRATMYYNGEYPDLVNVNEITYIKPQTIAYQIMIRYLKCSDFPLPRHIAGYQVFL